MEHFIALPYGVRGEGFKVGDLVGHIKSSFREYIIQGQVNCNLADHPKPRSLDVWIRKNYTRLKNTKQATNNLIEKLIDTGFFEAGKYSCPDSGRMCKGIRIKTP